MKGLGLIASVASGTAIIIVFAYSTFVTKEEKSEIVERLTRIESKVDALRRETSRSPDSTQKEKSVAFIPRRGR